MVKRKAVPRSTVVEILAQSRRRCCICYGLKRDSAIKKGQVAHLDGDSGNFNGDNLAYLCFDHHDEYDSTTSQTKSLQVEEVKKYRQELYDSFEDWQNTVTTRQIISFLLSRITLDDMVDAAIEAAARYTWASDSLLIEVLTESDFESTDGDLWIPYLGLVEEFHSWGWLDYTFMEDGTENEYKVSIKVEHRPICQKVLNAYKKRPKNNEQG